MRRIINATYISLDGVIERPHEWPSAGDHVNSMRKYVVSSTLTREGG